MIGFDTFHHRHLNRCTSQMRAVQKSRDDEAEVRVAAMPRAQSRVRRQEEVDRHAGRRRRQRRRPGQGEII